MVKASRAPRSASFRAAAALRSSSSRHSPLQASLGGVLVDSRPWDWDVLSGPSRPPKWQSSELWYFRPAGVRLRRRRLSPIRLHRPEGGLRLRVSDRVLTPTAPGVAEGEHATSGLAPKRVETGVVRPQGWSGGVIIAIYSARWFRLGLCLLGVVTAPLIFEPIVRSGGLDALDWRWSSTSSFRGLLL